MNNGQIGGASTPQPGYLLGSVLIAGLVLPQLAMFVDLLPQTARNEELITGSYIIYVGLLFLSSYYWSDRTFVLRGFMWVCENFSHPRGRRMAFFYFALCAFLGCMAILAGFGMIQTRN